ncbi:helix-turn-helix domain-containing protein [Methanobacterium veterum]|uniref:Helix-turn-helix domain-containing protein n=1 Tax=Methanobacterium veterum TaxID=408577 RepID=A0A9E4ZYW2_9EURY|nr:helix-turn-helix domain-containing protein [Methanobacterium veterum]MCZ3366528.1 helix-turn-helix domain-containing protein [Methanobacterium veterum]
MENPKNSGGNLAKVMITNITKEKDLIKALDKSECNDAIVFYDENYEKIPENYHWNATYVKINKEFISALKQVKGILRENELCEFFIEHNNVSVYLMYGVLSDETNYNIYIFENGEFELLPPQKNKLDNYEILILKTLVGNQYNAAEIIRKSGITKTLVYDRLKRLQNMGLIVKSNRKYELDSLGSDFLELI